MATTAKTKIARAPMIKILANDGGNYLYGLRTNFFSGHSGHFPS